MHFQECNKYYSMIYFKLFVAILNHVLLALLTAGHCHCIYSGTLLCISHNATYHSICQEIITYGFLSLHFIILQWSHVINSYCVSPDTKI